MWKTKLYGWLILSVGVLLSFLPGVWRLKERMIPDSLKEVGILDRYTVSIPPV